MHLLRKHKSTSPTVIDPFCGRGTTLYAARKLGLKSLGLDTSPIATAIAQAKHASADAQAVVDLAETYLAKAPRHIPETPFFRSAFSMETLAQICSLREGLLNETRTSNVSAILRAAALGCLHGPMATHVDGQSYFSNQMPRTFASKPDYSLKYWNERGLKAPNASVIRVLTKKLERISDLNSESPSKISNVKCRDARSLQSYPLITGLTLTVTSPPYYGMRTYVQDQWLRMWFLGGPEKVVYENSNQLDHGGHDKFVADLAKVWRNIRERSDGAELYVRFGSIPSAKSDARHLIKSSLQEAGGWRLVSVRGAKTANSGKRQADQMGRDSEPVREYDFHATAC